MTPEDDNLPERGRDDLLAAEYVLGVLDGAEREAAARRVESDAALARAVDGWEASLAPLAGAYAPVEPPASVKPAIDRRLFGSAAATASMPASRRPPSWWSSLAVWRGLTAAALAAFVVALAVPYFSPVLSPAETSYMAMLKAETSDVSYAAMYDEGEGRISLAHMSGTRAADRDFELWMIEGSNPPMSVGVLPAGDMITITLTPEVQAKLAGGAVLAISVEPLGGSPTGQPTGPVVAAGDLKSI